MLVTALQADTLLAHRHQLEDLLRDAVERGASIGFLSGLGREQAAGYWDEVREAVLAGSRMVLAAWRGERIVGTVQLDLCRKPNGVNRAEVQKLIVASWARREGVATGLMGALEDRALELERGLLFLDTEAGSGAEALYRRLGYQRVGELPDFACSPDGHWHPTAIYYKTLFTRHAVE